MIVRDKNKGQIFTPAFIVDYILNMVGYECDGCILDKHIIDNSCGDGAFLCRIVDRYCSVASEFGLSPNETKSRIERYIHGIEIDAEAHRACVSNLDSVAARYGLENVAWDVICDDALRSKCYDGIMDYVVGNPPYVRVHNLKDSYISVKKYSFAASGMTDLYLVFFEIGLKMLKRGGRLCYITPVSWLTSLAGQSLRTYVRAYHCLHKFADLGHFQPFAATAYTAISLFVKGEAAKYVEYHVFNKDIMSFQIVDTLSYDDIFIDNKLYFSRAESLGKLRRVKCSLVRQYVIVKNGFATLADKVFFGDLPFDSFTIDVLKASTGKWVRGLFPYHNDGTPLDWATIETQCEVAEFLNANSADLLKGRNKSATPDWYLYGRTQALRDVQHNKIAINTIIRNKESIKLTYVESGKGVYNCS